MASDMTFRLNTVRFADLLKRKMNLNTQEDWREFMLASVPSEHEYLHGLERSAIKAGIPIVDYSYLHNRVIIGGFQSDEDAVLFKLRWL